MLDRDQSGSFLDEANSPGLTSTRVEEGSSKYRRSGSEWSGLEFFDVEKMARGSSRENTSSGVGTAAEAACCARAAGYYRRLERKGCAGCLSAALGRRAPVALLKAARRLSIAAAKGAVKKHELS